MTTALFFSINNYGQEIEYTLHNDTSAIDWTAIQDSIFSPISMAQVHSGFLLDRGLHVVPYTLYDGTVPSEPIGVFEKWRSLYYGVRSSALTDSFAPPSLENWIELSSPDRIPIAYLAYSAERIALTDSFENYIEFREGRFHDVSPNGIPFETKLIVAAAAEAELIEAEEGEEVSFEIPSTWIHSNLDLGNSFSYDFGSLGSGSSLLNEEFSLVAPPSGSYTGTIQFVIDQIVYSASISLVFKTNSTQATNGYEFWPDETFYVTTPRGQ
jgi:hypothetical protein